MNYKVLFIISFVFFFAGCEQNNLNKNLINQEIMTRYKNTGFALVYENELHKEKKITKNIDNRALLIFHKSLKKKFFCEDNEPLKPKNSNS